MIEYNPNLVYLIYDPTDYTFKVYTGRVEYYWADLAEALFDTEGSLELLGRLHSWMDLADLEEDLESNFEYIGEETLHTFNNLKEAGDFLTDKLMIMELVK